MKLLVVTAVEAERAAIVAAGVDADVLTVGVGPAEAAARTSAALAGGGYDLVLCAGIGGGFAPLTPGDIAVASTIVFGDLDAWTGDSSDAAVGADDATGFVAASELGFGIDRYEVAPKLSVELADRTGGHLGTIVTVATVTGSAAGADALRARFPDAVGEGMEGAGVAAAAVAHHVAFGELRAVSNQVGPRDRSAWQIPLALSALGEAVRAALS